MRLRRNLTFIQASVISAALCFAFVSEAKESAPTAEQIERAAESFDHGRSAFRTGGFIEAAESFEAADSYAPSSAALRLAMLSRARADQLDRALTLAALGVSLYPEDAELQKEANDLIARHGSALGRLEVRCDTPCKLLLDNKLVHGKHANERTLFVSAGKHRLRVNWADGHVKNLGIKIEAGATDSIDLLTPTEPVSDEMNEWINSREELPPGERAGGDSASGPAMGGADKTGSRGWPKAIFWTGAGLTAAGTVTTIALGIRAVNEPGADAVRENCNGDPDCPEYQEGLRNQTMANVALGTTAVIGVFTLVTGIWITDWGGGEPKLASGTWRIGGDVEVRPLLGFADGPGLGAAGRF